MKKHEFQENCKMPNLSGLAQFVQGSIKQDAPLPTLPPSISENAIISDAPANRADFIKVDNTTKPVFDVKPMNANDFIFTFYSPARSTMRQCQLIDVEDPTLGLYGTLQQSNFFFPAAVNSNVASKGIIVPDDKIMLLTGIKWNYNSIYNIDEDELNYKDGVLPFISINGTPVSNIFNSYIKYILRDVSTGVVSTYNIGNYPQYMNDFYPMYLPIDQKSILTFYLQRMLLNIIPPGQNPIYYPMDGVKMEIKGTFIPRKGIAANIMPNITT